MPLTRAARKLLAQKRKPEGNTSRVPPHTNPSSYSLLPLRDRITPEVKQRLLRIWDDPDTLEWVIDNEKLTLGALVEMGIAVTYNLEKDDIDWAELEQSSEDEDLASDGPRDVYGVPMDTCEVCHKVDVGTRIPSCWHCGMRAHASCLRWTVREDPRKPGHYQFHCPSPPRTKFLEWH